MVSRYSKTITDSKIKYIIPINYNYEGSIMISYTDGPNANYWNSVPDSELNKKLHAEVTKLYPEIESIPKVNIFKENIIGVLVLVILKKDLIIKLYNVR